MGTALLDCHDSLLQLWHGDSVAREPGFALLEQQQYRFGDAARAAARLSPRQVHSRYWWQLDTEPLRPTLGRARHSADLVHGQLLQLHREGGEPGQLLLSVPGNYSAEQLSLLLGIARQCPFEVTGLVHRSALLAAGQPLAERAFHLELQLHQALLCELHQSGDSVQATAITALPGFGLVQLQERLAGTVAQAFVRQTRFDPRRAAATEQALFDALPGLLAQLAPASAVEFELAGQRATLHRDELAGVGERLAQALLRQCAALAGDLPLLLEPVALSLPGLQHHFGKPQATPADALPLAAAQLTGTLQQSGSALALVDRLPRLAQPPARAASTPRATHLLSGSNAQPLPASAGEFAIVANGRGWQLQAATGTEVNGRPAAPGQALAAGDRIVTGSREYLLITVAEA